MLPTELAEYPPLAKQYFLKGVKPSIRGTEPWGSMVKSLLKKLSKSGKMRVIAEIDSKCNAILYGETEVRGKCRQCKFNELQ